MTRRVVGFSAAAWVADTEARATGEGYTVLFHPLDVEPRYSVMPSREYVILKENHADHGLLPVCSILPNGEIETYHARMPGER